MTRFQAIVRAITPPIALAGVRRLRKTLAPAVVAGRKAQSPQEPLHRRAVGGMWDQVGPLQFGFLVDQGLNPSHKLLDVGCGSLRGGVHFLRYLENGNYYGIDASEKLLEAGVGIELHRSRLEDRTPHLLCSSDFYFSAFDAAFDYAIALSVFTHLPWNSIMRCLGNIATVLEPNGQFFATFFEDPYGQHWAQPITHDPGGIVTFPDRDPYHYPFSVFEQLATRSSLRVRYIGPWRHPRNQMMMVFTPL